MAERGRELIDVTQQEFFVGLERKFLSYETSDELIKKRYLPDFIKGGFLKRKPITNISLEVNKFITFNIEGVIKIRMAIPLTYVCSKENNFIYCPIEMSDSKKDDTDNEEDVENVEDVDNKEKINKEKKKKHKPLLSGYIKKAKFKPIDMQFIDGKEIVYDSMALVLNGIRRKFYNTIYRETDIDFIEDFFESFYKEYIADIVINLANSHFEEAEVKKYGNSYSILYRDLEGFKKNNPYYDPNNIDENIYSIFTMASLPFEFENLEVDDTRFSELDVLMNYRIRALIEEDEIFEDFNLSDDSLTEEEFEERSLFMLPVIDFKNEIYSFEDEEFTPEIARDICALFGMNEEFYERTKPLEVLLSSNAFLKYCIEHYFSLVVFYSNIALLKEEKDKEKEEVQFQQEIQRQNLETQTL